MVSKVDWMDSKVERLSELGLALRYNDSEEQGVFFANGRLHDHSCCPDCCGCEDEYSQYQTLEEYMGSR